MISNAELWRVRPQWRNTNSTRKGQVWPEQTFWRVCNPEFYLLEKERVKLVLLDRSIQASALGARTVKIRIFSAQRLIVTSPTIPMRSRIVHELYPCRSQPLVFIIHATWAYITYYLSLSAHNVTKMFAFLLVLYPKSNRIVFFFYQHIVFRILSATHPFLVYRVQVWMRWFCGFRFDKYLHFAYVFLFCCRFGIRRPIRESYLHIHAIHYITHWHFYTFCTFIFIVCVILTPNSAVHGSSSGNLSLAQNQIILWLAWGVLAQ